MATSKKTTKSGTTPSKGGTQKATRRTAKAGNSASGNANGKPEAANPGPRVVMTLTHEQIAQRAYEIWQRKGQPRGRDYENWVEAEAELLNGRAEA